MILLSVHVDADLCVPMSASSVERHLHTLCNVDEIEKRGGRATYYVRIEQ